MIKNAVLAWLIPALIALGVAGISYTNSNTDRIGKVEQRQADDSQRLERVENKVDEVLKELARERAR